MDVVLLSRILLSYLLAAAMIFGTSATILSSVYPSERRGKALSRIIAVAGFIS